MTLTEYKNQEDPRRSPSVVLSMTDFEGHENKIEVWKNIIFIWLDFSDRYIYTLEHGEYGLRAENGNLSVFSVGTDIIAYIKNLKHDIRRFKSN